LLGSDHLHTGESLGLLANILISQKKLGDEVKELCERSLAIILKNEGPHGINVAIMNQQIGRYNYTVMKTYLADLPDEKIIEYLKISKSYYQESVRIFKKIFGPSHPNTIGAVSELSMVTRVLSEA
jgi:uncharacterized protein YwbE